MSGAEAAAQELARKRARDRKAQKAMRERTRWQIQSLEVQSYALSQALETETRTLREQIQGLTEENKRLRSDNIALQARLQASEGGDITSHAQGPSSPDKDILSLETLNFQVPNDDWTIDFAQISDTPPSPSLQFIANHPFPTSSSTRLPPVPQIASHDSIPINVEPSCLADQILYRFVEARRKTAVGANITPPRQPNMSELLMPRTAADGQSVTRVVNDVLSTYDEIETLPKKVACLYLIYKLLSWLIFRTPESFEQLPPFLRPEPIQLQVPHFAWIDRLPWPRARVYLVQHPEITLDDFAKVYSSTFNVSWPYNDSDVVIVTPGSGETPPEISINAVYEQHLQRLHNWTVGKGFRKRFPELSQLIDLDSEESRRAFIES